MSSNLNDSDKIDACIKLAQFSAGRHDARRNEEWKLNFSLWGFLLGTIVASRQYDIQVPVSFGLRVMIATVIVLVYAFYWQRPLWVANERDKRRVFFFRTEAARIMDVQRYNVPNRYQTLNDIEKENFGFFGFLRDWSMRVQLCITIALLYTASWLVKFA